MAEAEGGMPIDSPTYVAPNNQDLLLTDAELFDNIGELLGVRYLSESPRLVQADAVKGIVFGENKRLMVNLMCKRKVVSNWVNIIFLVDTGSPHTYLSPNAIDKLSGGTTDHICNALLHSESICIECHLSPQDKHFKDVNVLGMGAMSKLGFSDLRIDFNSNEFVMLKR